MTDFFSNRVFRSRYQVALALVGLLSITTYLLISSLLSEQSEFAHIINISGKQRMLSQKISLYTEDYLRTKSQSSLIKAKNNLSLFIKNHSYITDKGNSKNNSSVMPVHIREFYENTLNSLVDEFKLKIEAILKNKGEIFDFNKLEFLLKNLNEAVSLFEKESDTRVSFLLKVELFIVIFTLLILYLEAKFIFRPLNKVLKETISDLEDKTQKAMESSRLKTLFISSITHELRTPLSGIVGASNLMTKKNLDKTNQDYFKIIESCSNSMLRIVDEILEFSKYENSNVPVNMNTFDLSIFASSIKQQYQEKAFSKNLTWEINYPEKATYIETDEVRIYQIINNLLNNSFKYTVTGKVSLAIDLIDNNLLLVVEDTGDGISDVKRALEPFYRQKEHEKKQINGIGIGLSIVNKMVANLNGTIDITSKVNQGTKVSLVIPVKLKNKDEVKKIEAVTEVHKHFLIVEDNIINQKILSKYLEKLGSTFDISNNGSEALDLLNKNKYDGILTDIKMPVMDGLVLLENIRKDKKFDALPVVAITANANRTDVELYRSKGFNDVISKPIKPLELVKVLIKND